MKALLPHIEKPKTGLFDADFYWFVKCPDCGVMVASGIFNQVEHQKKFHSLDLITNAMCNNIETIRAVVSDSTKRMFDYVNLVEEMLPHYDECTLLDEETGKLYKVKDIKTT